MQQQQAFIKKTITLIIQTSVGDSWKSDTCEFKELKGEEGYVVELRGEEK
jgi:hypothetical protein